MALLLLLETSGKNCSISLVDEQRVIASKSASAEHFLHAEQLHGMLEELIVGSSITWSLISAVAVSRGPGSYTGLRIGVSAAKGLCFALKIPLISIDTTQILADYAASFYTDAEVILSMIDAGRMEVYTAHFDGNAERQSKDSAVIIDEHSFSSYNPEKLVLVGDGAEKCNKMVAKHTRIISTMPSATMMHRRALDYYREKKFEDVAYFEPFYLKEYTPGVSRKSVL